MTDETTARDRAIEVVAAKLYAIHGPLSTDEDSAEADGQDVVAALQAHPEVLRALAGAPTVDVAALRKRIADTLHMGLDDATPNDPMADDDDHERWVARVQEWADWVHEQYAPLLAAAPEGVDAADELARLRKRVNMLEVNWQGEQIARDEYMEEARRLADELTAAQAAIQRVREKHFQTVGGYCHVCATWDPITGVSSVPYPCPTVRALDGDTTEEKR